MRFLTLIAALVFVVDQATKYAVVYGLGLHSKLSIAVLPPYLTFQMAWNRGVNFGLFSNDAAVMRWVLVVLALAISAWVLIWAMRGAHSRLAMAAAGVLIGGALGNVADRVFLGAVADFLNMSCCGIDNPYSFNLADVAIFAGALGLVMLTGRDKTP